MDLTKAKVILEAATGLKRYEWERIVREVNKRFEAASNRIELTREDAEGAEYLLRLEEGETLRVEEGDMITARHLATS